MSRSNLAHYEILALLGRGGMGEVHRARDTRLGREVALKLLPESFAADPERLARFRREAKVLASLQHPNIAGIFGLEEADGRVFLTMELAEGVDLSERIARGPVPEEEVLDIARQLAAGLEEAHENGVVHRDLKPANIKLGSDGKVKILDFGLARAFAGETAGEESLENSPTITAAMTQGGAILGTAAYMSPEQARGRKVDRRADIWSFGVVLFEMLAGKRLFAEDTISDTLAAVLRADLEWDRLPDSTSPGLRRLLERCLERDPLRRLRDIGEARIFLEAGAQDSSLLGSASSMLGMASGDPDATSERRGLPWWATAALALVFAGVGLFIGAQVLGREAPPRVFNTALPPPAGGTFHLNGSAPGPVAISPDGTMVAYSARGASGVVSIHVRRLDRPEATPLAGTEDAVYPFWSADSRFIAYGARDKLKKVPVTGGPAVTLCNASNMKGGTWNADGVILFAPDHESGIHRVSSSGGQPVAITALDAQQRHVSHRHPRFLPGGERFLYVAPAMGGVDGEQGVYLATLDGSDPRLLAMSQTQAEYSDGHLLTSREDILLASPFDPQSGELGDPVPLVDDLLRLSGAAAGIFASTADGMLVYQVATGSGERTLEWLGEGDVRLGQVGDPGQLSNPRVSPDGTQAAVEVREGDSANTDLWLVNLETGLRTRFTFDAGSEGLPIWTPDGTHLVYTAAPDSTVQIVMRPVEGTGRAVVLHEGELDIGVTGITRDGRTLLVTRNDPETSWNLYSMSVDTGVMEPLVVNRGADFEACVSPDGRWFAYCAENDGEFGIFVGSMTGGERRWQVNRESSVYPFWSPDGTRLFFIGNAGELWWVPVDGSGSTFRSGAPQLFANVAPPTPGGVYVSIHPDGERVLNVSGSGSDDESGYLRLVTDWRRGLAK